MAWRIQDQVIEGEIDNREQGRITGWLRLTDGNVIQLDLLGNAAPDIAGTLIRLVNPQPQHKKVDGLLSQQRGQAGEFTASRKRREITVSPEVYQRLSAAERESVCRWTNCLYLEWYNASNGRVVVESAHFGIEVVDGPLWRLSPETPPFSPEGEKSFGLDGSFFKDDVDEETDEYGEDPEMDGPSSDPLAESEAEKLAAFIEKMQAAGERARKWKWMARSHPLVAACIKLARELAKHCPPPAHATPEHPFCEIIESIYSASRKLKGALGPHGKGEWPPDLIQAPLVLIFLKQASVCYEDALRALESIEESSLQPDSWCDRVADRIRDLRRETDRLTAEARRSL
jgi:hypothetical protein